MSGEKKTETNPITLRYETIEETSADGTPIAIQVEHIRWGEKYYRIIWRPNVEPEVIYETAVDAAE